jgi:cytochrome P450
MTQRLPRAEEILDGDPFAAATRGLDERCPAHAALRAAAPVAVAEAPAGGPVWIVTDGAAARSALVDPRLAKDTALAPPSWNRWNAGLEPTAAEHPSLTTLDGAAHTALRRAHAPILSAQRVRGFADRITRIAADLLAAAASEPVVDLMADFTTRYPLTVLCELLGVPVERVDEAAAACHAMFSDDPAAVGRAMGSFTALAEAALAEGRTGLAAELREHVPAGTTADELHYLIFTLLFAGQLTTDPAAGFLLAHLLADADDARPADDLVRDVLHQHPPAPFSLWRFATEDVELAGTTIPAGSPVLIDIEGISGSPEGPDLTFGGGPHFCTGAHLARLELRVLVDVLRADFPGARLAVPVAELRQTRARGTNGSRLAALPVRLRGAEETDGPG